jgi:protein O-mannosyl-transferase
MNLTSDRSKLLACCLLLFIGTFLLFLPAVHHEFLNYDDDNYITESDLVQQGLTPTSAVEALLGHHSFMWHPVATWSLQLDHSLFGADPAGYHLMNVIFHSLSCCLVFLLIGQLGGGRPLAFFMAILFAWHPLRVESVAWAAERKDVLSTLFWLLTLHCYLAWHRGKSKRFQALTYAAAILATMSKPITITLPFTLLLLDYWPLQRLRIDPLQDIWERNKKLIHEKAVFFALSILLAVATLYFQAQTETILSLDELPLPTRLTNACIGYLSYLEKIIYPVNLSVFYPPQIQSSILQALISMIFFALIGHFAWRERDRKPYLLFGLIWFLTTLLPVIGLLQSGRQAMADRYSYFSSLGITIGLVFYLAEVTRERVACRVMKLATCLIAGMLMLLTHTQLSYWQNSETLFRHALAVTRNNFIAHINLGAVLANQGNLAEALPHYEAALQIRPSAELHYKLGIALLSSNQPRLAQQHLEKAVELKPDFADAYFELAMALTDQNQLEAGARHLQKALALKPELQQHLKLPPPSEPAKRATGTP